MRKLETQTARRFATAAAAVALSLSLTACFGDDDDDDDPLPAPPPASPAPTPPPSTGTLDVSQCLAQEVFPDGTTVANLVIPDVLNIDPSLPAGFPNGRLPADPVIDVTLAVLFLDITAQGQGPTTFADLPLNPDMNDVALPTGYPYLAPPQGNPPIAASTGTNFNFRTDSDNAFVRVDRMGFPAVSTALVPSELKIPYNDAGPVQDANGEFVDPIVGRLTALTEALQDDLTGLGFELCAD